MTNNKLTDQRADGEITADEELCATIGQLRYYAAHPGIAREQLQHLLAVVNTAAIELSAQRAELQEYRKASAVAEMSDIDSVEFVVKTAPYSKSEAAQMAWNACRDATPRTLNDAERQELQEYRKARREYQEMLEAQPVFTCPRCGVSTSHPEGWHYCHHKSGAKNG